MADAQGKFVAAAEPFLSDLPEGWTQVRLEEVLDILDRFRSPINNTEREARLAQSDQRYPYYGATGQAGEIDDYLLEGEAILLGEDAAPFLELTKAKAYLVSGRYWVNNHAHILRALGDQPNAFYMHQLNTVNYAPHVSGTTRLKLTQGEMRKIKLVVAPLAEQRRIVSRIDELFSRIEAGERAIAAARAGLKHYRKSILKAAVTGALTADWREERGEPSEKGHQLLARALKDREQLAKRELSPAVINDAACELPPCWAWTTLDRLTVIKGGVTVDRKKLPDDPVTLPYLRVANVQDGRIDLSEIKEITVERKKAEDCLLRNGDILLNEGGDLDKLGRGWVWEEQITPCIHQNHVFRARPVNASINPYFVSHYANTMGRTFFMDKGKHSVNLASISLTEISKLPVPLPPADEQTEIVSRVAEALSRMDHAEATLKVQARNARALKQSILKAAFEGRLVPQDPNEEPAADLLARIATDELAPAKKMKARA